jgi:hypothetical protein
MDLRLRIQARARHARIGRGTDTSSFRPVVVTNGHHPGDNAHGVGSFTGTRSIFDASTTDPPRGAAVTDNTPDPQGIPAADAESPLEQRDLADVPAVEVIGTLAVHLMSAAAVKLGLAENGEADLDLDEARKLITALAGLITAAAPEIGSQHAGPLRDGLRTLQLAFREASPYPDEPGQGPGEKFTGAVYPRA